MFLDARQQIEGGSGARAMTLGLQAHAQDAIEHQRQEADQCMGADTVWQAMMHRRDLDVGFQNAESTLNVGETLVAGDGLRRREVGRIGQQRQLAVEELSSGDGIRQLSQEEGISEATLHKWRAEARGKGQLLPDADVGPHGWSSRDKFAAVLESAAMNEAELAEYCRKRGFYPAQVMAWRSACEQANDWDRASTARLGQATKEEKKRIKDLERELARKDRALAETAALLVLRKKASAIWGGGEDA